MGFVYLSVGYYWIDYYGGTISANALKIESDSEYYVGQVTRNNGFSPAIIQSITPRAKFFKNNKDQFTEDNIKVVIAKKKSFIYNLVCSYLFIIVHYSYNAQFSYLYRLLAWHKYPKSIYI